MSTRTKRILPALSALPVLFGLAAYQTSARAQTENIPAPYPETRLVLTRSETAQSPSLEMVCSGDNLWGSRTIGAHGDSKGTQELFESAIYGGKFYLHKVEGKVDIRTLILPDQRVLREPNIVIDNNIGRQVIDLYNHVANACSSVVDMAQKFKMHRGETKVLNRSQGNETLTIIDSPDHPDQFRILWYSGPAPAAR